MLDLPLAIRGPNNGPHLMFGGWRLGFGLRRLFRDPKTQQNPGNQPISDDDGGTRHVSVGIECALSHFPEGSCSAAQRLRCLPPAPGSTAGLHIGGISPPGPHLCPVCWLATRLLLLCSPLCLDVLRPRHHMLLQGSVLCCVTSTFGHCPLCIVDCSFNVEATSYRAKD